MDYQNLYELRDYTPGLYLSSWPYIFAVFDKGKWTEKDRV